MDPLSPPTPSLDALPGLNLLEGLADLHQAVIVIDEAERVLWMSAAFAQLCGRRDVVYGLPVSELLHQRSHRAELVRSFREQGSLTGMHAQLARHGAEPLPVEFSAVTVPANGSGRVVVAIVRPLEEAERRDRKLEHTIEYLRAILDSSGDAVLAVDRKGFITYANPAVERLIGRPAREVMNQPISLLVPPSELERMTAVLKPTTDSQGRDIELACSAGAPVYVSASASRLHLRDGTHAGSVIFLRDVTDRRRSEQELARKNSELEQYVHTVSHDLRSPLVSLIGFTRLLGQDYGDRLDDKGRHFLERIEQAGRTMENLISDLLELSRIGQPNGQKAMVDPLEVLLQLQAELKPRLESQRVDLELPEAPPLVLCDRTRLYQVFSNLIGNAIDHMGDADGCRIRVDVEEEPDAHVICVSDNGVGIDPEHHERIFEIFQSLGPRSGGRRSTGIGLAIVKKIVETHGGRVSVESRPSEGATFRVHLPRA